MPVQTVTGEIPVYELGIVAAHEHAFIDLSSFYVQRKLDHCIHPDVAPVTIDKLGILNRDPYAIRDNLILDNYQLQKDEITYFKLAGGSTLVDVTTVGIGRNPRALLGLSLETGLNIVISTGYYVNDAHPSMIIDMNADEIAEIMCREILEGIDDTGIKAGVIGEIGVGFQMMNNERKVLEASAIANRRTGRPIHVHINPWSRAGIEASELLLNAGVDPNRICINHVDVKNDEEYIYSLLRKGVFIEFDNFGKEYYIDRQARNQRYDHFAHDTERVALLKKLICDGYSSQILLSCDVCLKSLLHAYGGWGYDHVLTNILPMMEDAGIDKSTVDSMLIDNPAYFLDDRLSL